jgi:hypothetical protein
VLLLEGAWLNECDVCVVQEHLRDGCLVGDAGEALGGDVQTDSGMQDEVDLSIRDAELVQAKPGVLLPCCTLCCYAAACMLR